jgi:putative thioredoxin
MTPSSKVAHYTAMTGLAAVTSATFGAEVIEASRGLPVLVDFWAPWCAPCRALAPELERLAAETEGRMRVVQLDTDDSPDVAQALGIRGIPALKLFVKAQVVAELVGAHPLSALRALVAPHLPHPAAESLAAARRLAAEGDFDGALAVIVDCLASDPGSLELAVLRARWLAESARCDEAEAVLDALPPAAQSKREVRRVRALLHFRRLAGDPSTDAVRAQAADAITRGDGDSALASWLERVREGGARRAQARDDLLRAFDWLDDADARVAPARRRLAALLY